MKRWIRLEWILAVGGVFFLALALARGWGEIESSFVWAPGRLAMALLLTFGGLFAVAISWAALHTRGSRKAALQHYLLVQPAKHIPGGVAHPASLISSSSRDGSVAKSTSAFLRFSLVLVSGGLSQGLLLLINSEESLIGAVAVGGAVVTGLAGLSSGVSSRFERLIAPLLRRFDRSDATTRTDVGVSRKQSIGAWFAAVFGIAGLSSGFAVLASSFADMPGATFAAGAFGVAWAIGYVAVPFPAGLGVRESVLMVVLGGPVGLGSIIASSVLQRLCQMIAELVGVLMGLAFGGRGPGRDRRAAQREFMTDRE